ncbi:hypothetical protein BSKO_11632 [Bryopsis sp. KO-2023]|nr:hypothetical protein BSKO_11632 [Bryopsis sp. KO-2023]
MMKLQTTGLANACGAPSSRSAPRGLFGKNPASVSGLPSRVCLSKPMRAVSGEVREDATVESPPTAPESAGTSPSSNVVKGPPRWIEEQLGSVELKSTLEHKLWVGVTGSLLFALLGRGILEIDSPVAALEGALAAFGGYLTIDLLSGIYHWSVDNYGSPATPLVGKQIEGFQGHHEHPWTITYREFCNNVHTICKPALPITSAVLLAHPSFSVEIFMAVSTSLAILAQQFHSWAHCKKNALPEWVRVLQNAGVLVSTADHCRHHRSPFATNYCIVSGSWNKLLDDTNFFYACENLVLRMTGVEPRCWNEGGQPDVSYYKNGTNADM